MIAVSATPYDTCAKVMTMLMCTVMTVRVSPSYSHEHRMLPEQVFFLWYGPLSSMQHVGFITSLKICSCHLNLWPYGALNTFCVLLCALLDFLNRFNMSLSLSLNRLQTQLSLPSVDYSCNTSGVYCHTEYDPCICLSCSVIIKTNYPDSAISLKYGICNCKMRHFVFQSRTWSFFLWSHYFSLKMK